MKRLIYILVPLMIVLGVYEWSSGLIDDRYLAQVQKSWSSPSVFTDSKIIKRQLVYEGNTVLVLYNYKPLLEGHLLIIPRREVERLEDLTPEEWVEMKEVIAKMHETFKKTYNASDYVLVLQNGMLAGQTVPHVHFHLLPRGDQSVVFTKAKLWQAFITEILGLRKPLEEEELQKKIQALQQQM